MTTSSTAPASNPIHEHVNPSEVGWQFVPQYYTFVNKQPNRLHCFYTKSSTFIHGTEGEDGKPCYGQQEIHNKITSIGFEDCKVFIHSVDAQSSANGGIIIQVIGELSNHGDPWRKFVQTFFLAEQPNGYFVLNDIFRFLKEETVEGEDTSEAAEATDAVPVASESTPTSAQAAPAPVESVYEPPREPTPPPAPAPVSAPVAPAPTYATDEAPTTDVPEPNIIQTPTPAPEPQPQPVTPSTTSIPLSQPNGIHTHEVEATPSTSTAAESISPSTSTPQTQVAPAPSATVASAPAPAAATPAATPAPSASNAARSWASLAATNSKKWGTVAQESRGITEIPSSPAPSSGTQTPAASQPQRNQHHQGQYHGSGQSNQGERREHPGAATAQSVNTAQCFIKSVTENISQTMLTNTLSSKFGPIKECEIVRSKACAFIEFNTVESAKRAITASLSQNQGGEGGVWIDVGGEVGQVRIYIETKKERGDRPQGRTRGGPPMVNGEGRGGGGFRGTRGGGRGRGGSGPKPS